MSFITGAMTTALSDGLGNVIHIAGLILVLFVVLFVFKQMTAAVTPKTIKRGGAVYELDKDYVPKLPKYQYFDGKRYVLKDPPDNDDPYEVDGESYDDNLPGQSDMETYDDYDPDEIQKDSQAEWESSDEYKYQTQQK